VTYYTAKNNKKFLGSEFVKECMLEVAELVSPENKTAFQNTALSYQKEDLYIAWKRFSDFPTQLNDKFRQSCASPQRWMMQVNSRLYIRLENGP
jgi:hypothetical protein